ncbi:acyl-CoA dehydrogenase [Propionibacteriaceae bacterium Y2011]
MSHYKSNLRDITFNLFEVLGRDEVLGTAPYADIDRDTAESILSEVDVLARTKLAPSFSDHERDQPVFDPQNHSVTMPKEFAKSYQAWMDAEFYRLELPEGLGDSPAPPSLTWSIAELVLGANPPIHMYGAGPKFGHVIYANGTERDKKIARHIVDRKWGATMVLTEPDAGSDVGAGRAKATRNDDGTWTITGVKRFITSGEHDMSENIVHLVLARPVGVEGHGGPGTKGLSLFLVPKHHFDIETGELTGERNGAFVTGVESKLGIKVSTTCELTFSGHGTPAKGWLLGEVHDGIAQMFQVIEYARMMVGTKAIATLSTGYLNALEYAKTRVQGPDMINPGKDAPRVTITHHPDVRRSLLTQKAFVEGMRSLVLYAATFQDRVAIAEARGEHDQLAERVNDLLLPIVKGYGSERSWVLLGTESLQTYGGSGFLTDYPIEQYVRDAKIDTLYEGTTAIQGQDLFFRKIVKDQGQALGHVSSQIAEWLASEAGNGQLKEERALLQRGLEDAGTMVGLLIQHLQSAQPDAAEGDPRNVYKVGLNTSRLLMSLGDVVIAWLLLRGAEVALERLNGELSESEQAFYEGKVASARWFAATVLPKLTAERKIAERTTLDPMDLAENAF